MVADKITFDMSVLKSLELLLVDGIDIHQLQGRSPLPGQLQALEIRRSLGSLKVYGTVYVHVASVTYTGGGNIPQTTTPPPPKKLLINNY